jgi:hypothetical protein
MKPTKAGVELLKRFAAAEAAGRVITDKDGNKWMTLRVGSGPDKAAASKLERDGLGKFCWGMSWGRHNPRVFRPTEAGRSALANL